MFSMLSRYLAFLNFNRDAVNRFGLGQFPLGETFDWTSVAFGQAKKMATRNGKWVSVLMLGQLENGYLVARDASPLTSANVTIKFLTEEDMELWHGIRRSYGNPKICEWTCLDEN